MPGARTAWSAIKQEQEHCAEKVRDVEKRAEGGWSDDLRRDHSFWSTYNSALVWSMNKLRTLPLGKPR